MSARYYLRLFGDLQRFGDVIEGRVPMRGAPAALVGEWEEEEGGGGDRRKAIGRPRTFQRPNNPKDDRVRDHSLNDGIIVQENERFHDVT